MHGDGDVVPLGADEVLAERRRRAVGDGVDDAVDAAPPRGEGLAHGDEVLGHGDVELEDLDVAVELAGRARVRLRPRPAPVSTIAAPSAWATRATANASEASVRTPVTTMFLPSRRPMTGDGSGSLARGPLPRLLASCASASSAARAPPAAASAARLASIGYDVVIGSRSKYRAMEAVDHLVEQWPELTERLTYGDNIAAADCDLVVIATPWDSAATTAQEHASVPARQGRHLDGQRPRARRPRVPAARAAAWQRRRPRAGRRAELPRRGRPAPPAGQGARPPRRADRLRRADLRRRPGSRAARSARSSPRSPAAARSTPASCPTPRPSRRSRPCCSSSTCATRPGSRRS